MAILTCIRPSGAQSVDSLWLSFFSVSVVYFLALFLYSVIPVWLYYSEFRPLPLLNRLTRVAISVSVALKALGSALALAVGLTVPSSDAVAMYESGICLMEFPCYVTVTCYSLLLLFWLTVCVQILPLAYVPKFNVMRIVLIVYNAVFYLVFVAVVAVNTKVYNRGSGMWELQRVMNGSSALARDFGLVVIFLVFVAQLKLSIREQREAIDERKLVRFTVMLAIALLLRGVVSLIQGLLYQNGDSDCDLEFWAMCVVQEVLLEGGPFFVLIWTNTKYLVERHRYGEKASALMVNSSIDA
jgi:hypothetical protein